MPHTFSSSFLFAFNLSSLVFLKVFQLDKTKAKKAAQRAALFDINKCSLKQDLNIKELIRQK
jgi:hypothetical protein